MKLARIVLLLAVALFAIAAAEDEENELSVDDDHLELVEGGAEDPFADDLGDDLGDFTAEELGLGEAEKKDLEDAQAEALGEGGEDHTEALGENGEVPKVEDAEFVLSEAQIQSLLTKIDLNGDGKASIDEFKLFAKNSALLRSRKAFDESYTGEYVAKTIDEHMEEVKKQEESGSDDATLLEVDRQKLIAADANKDGKLDKDEYFRYFSSSDMDVQRVEAKLLFESADTNNDGLVDLKEFSTHTNAGIEADESDKELLADHKKQFTYLDKDGSGKLDLGEFQNYMTNHHQDESCWSLAYFSMFSILLVLV